MISEGSCLKSVTHRSDRTMPVRQNLKPSISSYKKLPILEISYYIMEIIMGMEARRKVILR